MIKKSASVNQTPELITHSNYSSVSPSHDYMEHATEPNMEIDNDNSNDASCNNQNTEYTILQIGIHNDNTNYALNINHTTEQTSINSTLDLNLHAAHVTEEQIERTGILIDLENKHQSTSEEPKDMDTS